MENENIDINGNNNIVENVLTPVKKSFLEAIKTNNH